MVEPVRAASIPEYQDVKKKVLDAGAYGFQISGGGSSVIAICENEKVDEIAYLMSEGFMNNPYYLKVYKTSTSNQGVQIIS